MTVNLNSLNIESTKRLTKLRGHIDLSKSQAQALIAAVVLIQLTLLFVFVMHTLMIPAEAAKHLNFAMIVLQGKMPYKDIVDMVSPMMLYIDVIPAYIAKITHIHPIFVYNIFVWILSCISQVLCLGLVLKSQTREKYFLSIVILANSLLQLFFLQEFGQIDHLFLLFTVPYWLSRFMRWKGQKPSQRFAMLAGVGAGIGFSLSFLYGFFFLLIEFCFWLERRKQDAFTGPEFACCCAIMLLYLGHMIVLPEAMASSYLGWILPITFVDYWLWDDRLTFVQKTPDRRDLIYIFAIISVLAIASSRRSSLVIPAVTFSVLGFGLYLIQGQMFTYQALPMMWGTGFALALLIAFAMTYLPNMDKLVKQVIVAPVVLIGCSIFLYFQYLPVSKSPRLDLTGQNCWGTAPKCDLSNLSEFFEANTRPGDRVLILNDRARPAYPLILQLGLKPAGAMLDYAPCRVYENYFASNNMAAITKFIYFENSVWEPLSSMLVFNPPKLVLYDEDAMNPLLAKHLLKKTLSDLYPEAVYADWSENIDKHPKFEYLSFRYPAAAHVRKY